MANRPDILSAVLYFNVNLYVEVKLKLSYKVQHHVINNTLRNV